MQINYLLFRHAVVDKIIAGTAICLLSFIFSFTTASAQIPELIYFKCNSASGGNVANEAQTSTRVSTQGTLNGATIGGTGQFGAALVGNGGATASNSLNVNWALSLSGPWTLSLWMKGITNTATSNYIFGGSGGSAFRAMTGTGLVSGGGNLLIRGTGLTDIPVTGIFDGTGTAVVVHIVYDPSIPATRVYVNGVFINNVNQTASVALTGTDFRVGGYGTANGIPSNSLVDEFRLYNRALTANEIASTWNVDLLGGPPCPQPAAITINTFNSSSVDFSWTAVTGSQGYEYAVDQNATGPTGTPTPTTSTSALATGLPPGTQHYIHVRNKCTGNGISPWLTLPFQTLPACSTPSGFTTLYVDSDSASFTWTALTTGTDYQYIVNQSRNTPANAAAATTTVNNAGTAGDLAEGNYYYVHIRSRCPGNDSSDWSLDSFYTPVICRNANVQFTDITTNRGVAYWNDVLSAISYEYALTKAQAPPLSGIPIKNKSVLLPFLDDGTTYYFHHRTNCSDKGVETSTDWQTFEFKTHAVGVNNAEVAGSNVSVYPNPAGDVFYLNTNGKTPQDASVIITNVNGMAMQRLNITRDVTTIDIKGYAPGIYFVKYTDDNGTRVLRVIKQ